jgi:baculoviral IAP repeat-containing protein 7/8
MPMRPEHPHYAVEAHRIKSFENWPKTIKQNSTQLSDAGFFYLGRDDHVCCFSCGGILTDWDEDNPWEQHAMHYSKCEYLKLMKGFEYIALIQKRKNESALADSGKTQNSRSFAEETSSTELFCPYSSSLAASTLKLTSLTVSEPKTQLTNSSLCKICYQNDYDTVFLTCGHIVACYQCALSVSKCPCCRKLFTSVMRVYFS